MIKCTSWINGSEEINENEQDGNTEFDETLENFTLNTKCIGKINFFVFKPFLNKIFTYRHSMCCSQPATRSKCCVKPKVLLRN